MAALNSRSISWEDVRLGYRIPNSLYRCPPACSERVMLPRARPHKGAGYEGPASSLGIEIRPR
jgi:hypothetical protein